MEYDGNVDPEVDTRYKEAQTKVFEVWTGFRIYNYSRNEARGSPLAKAAAEPTTYMLVDWSSSGAQVIAASAVSLLASALLLA